MKKLYLLFIITASLCAQDITVRSLQTYTESIKSLPIVTPGQTLKISFDLEAFSKPSLIIEFRFCDKDWNPYENVFLLNQGYNTAYNLWFDNIPIISDNINYHYEDNFPNEDVTFPFSGKWKYFIKETGSSEILAEGRFYVILEEMPLKVSLDQHRLNISRSENPALERSYALSVDFTMPDTLFPMNLDYVEVIENMKLDYPYDLTKSTFEKNRSFETNGNRSFKFYARDIRPGNEYRQTNLRDKGKYKPPLTRAHFDGIEYTRFYDPGEYDNNGGFKLVDYENDFADYMLVNFEFSPDTDDDIFIVGSFTDWQVLPFNQLEKEGDIYTISFELKRGTYDYQYVSGRSDGETVEDIDWYEYEGNFWGTSNDYYIFVYYNSEEFGGYDKIIGYSKINSAGI